MEVVVSPNGTTTIINIEGTIYAIAQGIEVNIPQGMESIINQGQQPSQPSPTPSPTTTPTPSPTTTPTPSPTTTPTPSPTTTPTPSPTTTPTPSPTTTPTPSPTTTPITSPIIISTASLSNGEVGVAYSQTLAATGGTPPYTWSITTGILPAGLTLNTSSGAISGTPTTAGGPTSMTFKVTDAASGTATKPISITINPAASPSPRLH